MDRDLTFDSGRPAIPPIPSDPPPYAAVKPEGSQAYGVFDTIDSAGLPFFPRVFSTKEDLYRADVQHPLLPEPLPENERSSVPFGAAEQGLIVLLFREEVKALLEQTPLPPEEAGKIYRAAVEGYPLADAPALQAEALRIKREAIKAVQQREPRLSPDWSPDSREAKDWTPLPLSPYPKEKQREIALDFEGKLKQAYDDYLKERAIPRNSSEAHALWNALNRPGSSWGGAQSVRAILDPVTQSIQKKYGLPSAWRIHSQDPSDWQPIQEGLLTPSLVNSARGELLFSNIALLLEGWDEAAAKVSQELPPDSPHALTLFEFRGVLADASKELDQEGRITSSEFIRIISRVTLKFKNTLAEIQLEEAEQSQQAQQAKWDNIEIRNRKREKDIEKRREIERKRRKGEKVSLAMKIAGPVVAALSVMVGAGMAIFTFGASTALIVGGIAAGSAMMAYSVVDSSMGVTQRAMDAFNKLMEDAFPDNPIAQKALKAAIIATVVAVLAAAIVLSGGSAAGSVGASTSAQIAQAVFKDLSIQIIVLSVMASNALPELFAEILKSAGVSDKTSQIWEIVMMAVTMLAVMVAVSTGGKIGNAFRGLGSGLQTAGRTAQTAAESAMNTLKNLIEQLKRGMDAAITELINLLKSMLKSLMSALRSLGENLKELPAALAASVNNSLAEARMASERLMNLLRQPSTLGPSSITALENAQAALQDALNALFRALKIAFESAERAVSAGQRVALEQLQKSMDEVQRLTLSAANTLAKEGVQAARDILRSFEEIGRGLKSTVESLKLQLALRSGTLTAEQAQVFEAASKEQAKLSLIATQRVLQLTPEVIHVADGINRGVLGLQVVKLLDEVGRTKESIELLESIIEMLDKLLNSIQTGMDSRSDLMLSLHQSYNHFYDALSRVVGKMTHIQG